MRILVVCQFFYPEQFRINDICKSFVDNGHDVTVITGIPNYPTGIIPKEYRFFRKRREEINGIKVIRLPLISRKKGTFGVFLNYVSFAITSSIYSMFCKKDYDVIYVYQLSPVTMAIPAIIISKRAKIKVFLYCLDLWPESLIAKNFGKTSLLYNIIYKISSYVYKNVYQIAVSSKSFKQYFKSKFDIPAYDIEYIPQFAEDIFTYDAINKKINNEINLVFAGNIGEMQDVETIINAAALTKDIENLKWHIIGDGSARKRCEELVQTLNIEDKVIFHGYRKLNEMPKYYEMADAFLVTLTSNETISYTLPGKTQSYMKAGKPIIGAINGEGKRIIEESKCGLCSAAGDSELLAEKVRSFIDEPEKHSIYSRNSFRYYQNNFEKDIFIKKTLKILTTLCEV